MISHSTTSPTFQRPARAAGGLRPVVCHVVHSLNIGGAELLAARIANQLRDRYEPVFACLDDEGPLAEQLRAAGDRVIHLQRRGGIDRSCANRLRDWFQQQQVTLVHAHQFTPFSYTLLSGLWRKRPPVLFTEHGRFYPDVPSWKRRWLTRALLRRNDRLVAVGRTVRDALARVEQLPAERIDVIYNGVSTTPRGDARDRVRLRAEQGATNSDLVVAMVARLDPIKDHQLAIKAFQRLLSDHPSAQLWLIGDGPERAAIEGTVNATGLTHKIRLLGQRRDIPELLAAADAFLLTSLSEGIPLVLIEAMAAGLPVVATDVGGVSELITHESQGLLAPRGDAEQLSQHLLRLANSPELRIQLGTAGKQQASKFSEASMLTQYEQLYRTMTGATACR